LSAANNGIDEKRLKKRQRKQEKTRKVQSKLVYKHTETDPANSNNTANPNQSNAFAQHSSIVSGFGATERLQHAHSLVLERNTSLDGQSSDVLGKRARLADNHSVSDVHLAGDSPKSKRGPELEVDQLKRELEETRRQLREKTIEVEKSTQLFTLFDQQIREM